jgi:hypothetical protein
MAIWQFDLSFVPKSGPMPWRVDDGHEVPSLDEMLTRRAEDWLAGRFGTPWLLMDDWLVFGEQNGHRVDLVRNEDGGCQLSARISALAEGVDFYSVL